MGRTEIDIATEDGTCRASVFRPSGKGPWPGVLFYMDGIGYRPALFEIAERIAERGYVVLLPDLFYRAGDYEPPDPKKLFSDPALLAELRAKLYSKVSQELVMRDTRAFLDYLAAPEDVRQPHVGTTGYCMGGGFSLAAAGFYPERVAAAASFHGARLATDDPTSPHLLAPKMKARIYVAGAIEDASFPDDMKQRLDDALTEAHIAHTVETYPAKHGWVPSDTPVHAPAQAERHFQALFALFDSALRA
jgi:carboxymethylenebutenolidase